MTKFKTAVFEKDGSWWFKWWNVSFEAPSAPGAPLAQDLIGPFKSQQEAEAEKQKFEEAEKKKRPLVVFESAT
jgi:hypothetical protein